jgi:hypothetical protein
LGGKLVSAYVTTGQYDVVLTLDMPNGEAMAKFASAVSGSGNERTTTVRGYTPDEFSKLVAEAPKFYFLGNERQLWNSENSKANRIEIMKGPAESGQICSVGRRKIAKKIAKNERCHANTLRPRSRMLLKVTKGGLGGVITPWSS